MSTISIPLTQGKHALIDAEDLPLLGTCSWSLAARKEKYRTRNYAQGFVDKKMVLMHRVIMGAGKGQIIDHINGNGLDNRRANLRFVTPSQNNFNQPRNVNTASGYKGVYRASGRAWCARIERHGVVTDLGRFSSPQDAAIAYDHAAREMFGEYARFNFPRPGERPARDIEISKDAADD